MSRKSSNLILVAMALVATACTNPETPAGHEGYVFERPRVMGKGGFRGIVREPFRTFVRNAVQQYDSRQVKANRAIVAGQVQEQLQGHLDGTPFQLVSLVVGNIDYPEIVEKAVEAKLAAQQFLEEKETQKLIAQRDAEIRIEEAKGIAEAQKIINATLTPIYLEHESIRAQEQMAASPNHTTVYIPVGTTGLPLVHMPKN
jgi:regulator of protease activity HflC (stomatin/prohibitin superfamily)